MKTILCNIDQIDIHVPLSWSDRYVYLQFDDVQIAVTKQQFKKIAGLIATYVAHPALESVNCGGINAQPK